MNESDTKDSQAWALIPARGGSRSIPLKNLVLVGGRPLIEYVTLAARASSRITRIICSTDHRDIARVCQEHGVEIHWRPPELSGDDVPVVHVLTQLLQEIQSREGNIFSLVCLLQPTSPFVLPEHIDTAVEMLEREPSADSVQTVSTFPHNFHAYNQRIIEGGVVKFKFPRARAIYYNKQAKPVHYMFGNLVVTRTRMLMENSDVFGQHSLPYVISAPYAADVDEPQDLDWVEWLLATKKVILPHLDVE